MSRAALQARAGSEKPVQQWGLGAFRARGRELLICSSFIAPRATGQEAALELSH